MLFTIKDPPENKNLTKNVCNNCLKQSSKISNLIAFLIPGFCTFYFKKKLQNIFPTSCVWTVGPNLSHFCDLGYLSCLQLVIEDNKHCVTNDNTICRFQVAIVPDMDKMVPRHQNIQSFYCTKLNIHVIC